MFQLPDLEVDDLRRLAALAECAYDELKVELERKPWLLADLLSSHAARSLLDCGDDLDDTPSPYLFFAAMAYQTALDIQSATHVHDRTGPNTRVVLFDVEPLQEFIADPTRVLFVAAVLASFATPQPTTTPAEALNMCELAQWLDAVLPHDRGALLLQLGDLALFNAGVFAGNASSSGLSPADALTLGRSVDMDPDEVWNLLTPGPELAGTDALETLGSRWYEAASALPEMRAPILCDVAARFQSARRFVTHLADSYLLPANAQLA